MPTPYSRFRDRYFRKCLVCGQRINPKTTGRTPKFCSNACKQKDYRERRRWAREAVDAALKGEKEPGKEWRKGELGAFRYET